MKKSKQKRDLEERTFKFAKDVRAFIRQLPRDIVSIADGTQLIRSSGSIGANYIEAQEALSKKDFVMRVKTSRKEAKEGRYWLNLLNNVPSALEREHARLIGEVA